MQQSLIPCGTNKRRQWLCLTLVGLVGKHCSFFPFSGSVVVVMGEGMRRNNGGWLMRAVCHQTDFRSLYWTEGFIQKCSINAIAISDGEIYVQTLTTALRLFCGKRKKRELEPTSGKFLFLFLNSSSRSEILKETAYAWPNHEGSLNHIVMHLGVTFWSSLLQFPILSFSGEPSMRR